MSVRIHNAPDINQLSFVDFAKSGETNRDRQFSPGYSFVSQTYLGTDSLDISENYNDYTFEEYEEKTTFNYAAILKLLLIFSGFMGVIAFGLSAIVALGGIISAVILALLILVSVFLYSINLNPFDKKTYKRFSRYIF